MINTKITNLPIIVATAALLIVAAAVVSPANMVRAQSNASQTEGNLTTVIDVDTLSKNIKERHPILAQMGADEDKDLIEVIKDMDPKEAIKTMIALNMLRLLQQYKQVDVS